MKSIKLSLILLISVILFSCTEHKKFNSVQWKRAIESEEGPGLRWQMHNNLLENYRLNEYNKSQIFNLLGKPNVENSNEYRYYLGNADSGIDTGTMVIKFKKDVVVSIDIIRG